jgi:hypothetical protein
MRRRASLLLSAMVLLLVGAQPPSAIADDVDVDPFRGLGSWVDVFDYAPRLQPGGGTPAVDVGSIDDMAALGARTVFLQVANPDDAAPDRLTDAREVRALVARAHADDLAVVAWYLPLLDDVDRDYRIMREISRFEVDGRGFDGLALDIEYTQGEPDVARRNDKVVELTGRVDKLAGDLPLGAIVYPAVQLEEVNPLLWPQFPYRRLAPFVDVWQPMAYFTFRAEPYRDAERYVEQSVDRLRRHVGEGALVHVVGGVGDSTTTADLEGLRRAARRVDAVGLSLYDFASTFSAAWSQLRRTPS